MDKSRNLVEGDRLEVECSSWGWPAPNVTWWRRDAHSGVESQPTPATLVSDSAGSAVRLTIEHIALSDYSKYVCVAANTLGTTNATILVRVKGRHPIVVVCWIVTLFTDCSFYTVRIITSGVQLISKSIVISFHPVVTLL